MFFADLPPEILAQIVEYKDISHYLLELWKCGSKILNAKLASGVTYVYLAADLYLARRCPLMVSELRNLRYLHVISAYEKSQDFSNLVRKLSPTIESLHLNNPCAFSGFCNYVPGDDSYRPALIKTDYGRGETGFYDVSAHFPRLHTLELIKGTEGRLYGKDLPDFAGLPSTITRLITDDIYLEEEHFKIASYLPKSLRRLEATIDVRPNEDHPIEIFLNDWSLAPPQIEHVSKIILRCPVNDASWIPKTLTSGRIDRFNHGRFTPELAATLPLDFEHLTLSSVDYAGFEQEGKNWALELPKQLQTLDLDYILDEDFATTDHGQLWRQITNLPRSLTSFTLEGFNDNMSWQTLTPNITYLNWPSTLTIFDSWTCPTPSHLLHLLPSTITSFKVYIESTGEPILDATTLPPKLTLLHLNGDWNPGYLSITNQLPLSLTELILKTEGSEVQGVTRESFKRLQNLTSLKHLEVTFEHPQEFNPDDVPAPLPMPPNLEVLTVPVWDASWFASLPRSLTELHIERIEGAQRAVDLGLKFFLDIPPGLVKFTAVNRATSDVPIYPENSFPHLPKLRMLDIYTIGQFPSSVLRALPHVLRRLLINLKSIEEVDAPFIPPNLHQLFLLDANIALSGAPMSIAEHWPVRASSDAPRQWYGTVRNHLYQIHPYC